jgi:hypothetical protein
MNARIKEEVKMNLSQSKKVMATAFGLLLAMGAVAPAHADQNKIQFELAPNPGFVNCLARYPGDPNRKPSAQVTVTHGDLNDILRMTLRNIKPNLAFDLFTVERTALKVDGTVDTSIPNRGLAWYQSDVEVGRTGSGTVEIRTILLNQIFGFDPIVGLPPTHTFHVGFWFNDPKDVHDCDASEPTTPFNGEHHAGPLAMISLPDANTGLGPLCANPDFSTNPVTCNP